MRPLNVLSVFDGIACGRVALERAGIPIANYFASEINDAAITIARKNHEDITCLGNIQFWPSWNLPKIDLLLGGSPCQGLSVAGRREGLKDKRSKLFYTFVDILRELQPAHFLLENVVMDSQSEAIFTSMLGVQPYMINSAQYSAQNRVRMYWTTLPWPSPPSQAPLLENIIESGFVDRQKSLCLTVSYAKKTRSDQVAYFTKSRRQLVLTDQTPLPSGFRVFIERTAKTPEAATGWRHLTPKECERLQTLPDDYTAGIPEFDRYAALGNAWTVDVVAGMMKQLKKGLVENDK